MADEKAKAVKEKLAEQGADTKDFTVYDMPTELANQYISMAKLYYDNKVWKVLEHGMDLMREEHTSRIEDVEDRITHLEAKISMLEQTAEEDDSDDLRPTLGGSEPSADEALDALDELGDD